MSLFKQMKTVKEKVKFLLEKYPHLRDSDEKLISNVWYYEVGPQIENWSAMQLLTFFSKGNLPSTESIRRVRQKIQEQHPELRGERYLDRSEDAEEVRIEIRNL